MLGCIIGFGFILDSLEPLTDQVGLLKALFCKGIEQSPLKDPQLTQLVLDLLLLKAASPPVEVSHVQRWALFQ